MLRDLCQSEFLENLEKNVFRIFMPLHVDGHGHDVFKSSHSCERGNSRMP